CKEVPLLPRKLQKDPKKSLVGPENGTKPLANSKDDRAQGGNTVGTTRWSGTHVTSLKRRALSWVGLGLTPLAKVARESQELARMSQKVRKQPGCLGKPRNGRNVPESKKTAGMSKKARKWQKRPGKPGNGRDVPESQKMARMSQKARICQECPRKSGNDRDVRVSQEMARMSKQTDKWHEHPKKSTNDGNTRSHSKKSRNDQEAWLMLFAQPGGAGSTPFL
ncbi:hypothetical protein Taro_013883, partial [Colocasia esculenta]|nr:hypothetical protein [Colocasia esculenta]